jgi:hypothetical protein
MATRLQRGGAKPTSYDLVVSPIGYFNKREITLQDARALVKGSYDMIINDSDKVSTRKGFTLDGQARTVTKGINGSWDFVSRNGVKTLRSFPGATSNTGKLQVRTEYTPGSPIYADLLTGLTYTDFSFTTIWNDTEVIRELIFVDGTNTIRRWGGGIAYVASNTGTTLTLSGTDTFAQKGFQIAQSGRFVTIPGYGDFTYTGGENTVTLTGLTALPAIPVGTPILQGVIAITSLTGVTPTIYPNVVMTRDNQVWYGDTRTSTIWGSKNTDYSDCQFTTPIRKPGEGFKITLDDFTVGFTQDSDANYVFAGLSDLYRISFVLSSQQAEESIVVQKLRAGSGQSAVSNKAIIPVKNGIMYITNDKSLTWLTSIQNIYTPQSLPISDPIKLDWDELDHTGVTGIFFGNEVWVTFPRENLVYIYDFDKALWQPPQRLPLSSFSIINNELYGHSNSSDETYKLNSGWSDNGVSITYSCAFAYRQYGNRSILHQFDEYFTELYMTTDAIVTATHYFDYRGSTLIIPKQIKGTDKRIKFAPNQDGNLGKSNLGKNPLGSTSIQVSDLNKYRVIHEMKLQDFFEHQVIYTGTGRFEILAHGPNVKASTNMPISIKI